MKIVFIASANSIHTSRWIKFFINKRNEITLISFKKPNQITQRDINKFNNKIKILYVTNLFSLIRVICLLNNLDKSLVHIHYLGWHSLLSIFIKYNSKLILTPWGSDLLINKNNIFKKIWLKKIISKSNFMICDSMRLEKEAINLGMDKENILISMFGVETKIYKNSRKIFSNKEKYFIGSNRNHEDIYDLMTLLKAAKLICDVRDDVQFYIAGSGSKLQNHIKYIEEISLGKKVKFLGLLNKEEMISFYNKIDIYISTSLSDGGLSASIAEAMSFERLIIISDNSDNKNWVKNKINGYLFKTSDHKELAKMVINAIEKKENSLAIAQKSREIILQNYSYEVEMKKVEKMYKELFKNNYLN